MNRNRNIIFLFSGQGGQYRKMGLSLFEKNTCFRKHLIQYDAFINSIIHQSIIEELYESNQTSFDDLLITNSTIVALELALLATLKEIGITPDIVLGSSLGEFSAASAAHMCTAEDAISASIEMAKSVISTVDEGGMINLMDTHSRELNEFITNHNLHIAFYNFRNNYTVTGTKEQLDLAENEFRKKGILFHRLPVNYPFHCPLLEAAKDRFTFQCMDNFSQSNGVRFISGLLNEEIKTISPDYLWNVVSQYSDFSRSIQYIEQNEGNCLYIDLGCSGNMATFTKYNLDPSSTSKVFQIMTPYKRENEQLEILQSIAY